MTCSFAPEVPARIRRGVTPRAVVLGLVLIPVNSYWIFMMEIVRYQGHPTTISLFYSSIFNLVLLILANRLIRRIAPVHAFSQGELLTIYVMINVGAALVGHDSLQILVSLMPYATRFSTPENKWQSLFADRLPDWLIVKDKTAVDHFYLGGDLYDPANYGPWLVPVLWWSAFVIVLVSMFLCMNVLLRKQWTERERLSYPLVQLPLEMTSEKTPMFRNGLLWLGVGVAACIDIVNGISVLCPSVPQLPIKLPTQQITFTTRPWIYMGTLSLKFYPFGIGLGMLLPVDLLFSCWFFFLAWRAQYLITGQFGLETVRGMPFVNEQSFGAYMGISVFAIAVSRRHFINLGKHFLGMPSEVDDSGEPIRYRWAMWFLILGCMFLFWFSRRAGMSVYVIIPFFIIYFAMSVAITRMRAELGPPAHDLHAAGPERIIATVVGPRELGTANLSVMSMFFWFNRAYRSHVMPIQLEGYKMAERARISYSGLTWAMLIATIAGTFSAFWVILHLLYQYGAAKQMGPPNVPLIFGGEAWNRMDSWLKYPLPADTNRTIAIVIGFAVTIALNSLRMRIPWFPFHPVGYAVSSSWSLNQLWMALLVAWIIKLLVLRYGGLKLYRQVLPFFLGIIIGECVVGSLWTIIGIVFGVQSYAFWP